MPLAAEVPSNEQERLETLRSLEVLDTAPEASFDRITATAARIFRMPVALVSLLDRDRQWFKSRVGISLCETGREVAICAHAMLRPHEVTVVENTTLDARFADNPLVTGEPGLRFYAGAPLVTPEGFALGSLCVLDFVPRTFSPEEQATLADLAATVMEMLGLRQAINRAKALEETRERAETALRQSETRFRRMAANTPGMVYQFVLRPDGSFYFPYVSDGCREIYGIGPEVIYAEPRRVLEFLDAEGLASFHTAVAKSAATLEPWSWEGRVHRPNAPLRWVQGISRPERLPDGEILWDGMLVDITLRKKALGELEVSHNLLRAVIDGTDDAIFIKDRASRYLLINPAGAAFLNHSQSEIIGHDDSTFFSPAAAAVTRQHDLDIMESGQSQTYEDEDFVEGRSRVFLTTKSPYRDGKGALLGVIGIARDITKQRQDAVALREAKEEAERANQAKSDFLSRMSHELRTPLNAILGFGQLLEIGTLLAKQRDAVGHIMRAGRHLLALIDEVLSISRIEAGRMELSLEPVGVSDIAGECLSLVSRQAADRGVSCQNTCTDADEAGYHVLADRQRLRQVVLNLLSNAVKYNREGGRVILSCREAPSNEPDRAGLLRIGVTDTGAGLAPEEIARLFVPFERLRAERSSIEGTGLGLALSKGLVMAMGGRMGVDSVPGEGSTFWLELPLAENPLARLTRSSEPAEGERSSLTERPCHGTVLYIEDNLSNLLLIECVFESRPGLELLSVQQGTLGLEVAAARRPDLILLDLHLPDLPGWEVLARLRETPRTAEIPVVIISADATPGQINRLRAIGVLDYLTKPIDVQKLLNLLDTQLCPAGDRN